MLKVKTVADRLSLSLSAVYDLIEKGELPHYRIRGAIRVSEEQLKSFLADREVTRERRPAPRQRKTGPHPVLKHIRL